MYIFIKILTVNADIVKTVNTNSTTINNELRKRALNKIRIHYHHKTAFKQYYTDG